MKYHINPETGKEGVCTAENQCRFGSEVKHYASAAEAREAYEKSQTSFSPSPPKVHRHTWATVESRYNFEMLECGGCGQTRKVYDE